MLPPVPNVQFAARVSYGAQLCEVYDPLIDCVWHVNFGWLSTNNPIWLQGVSSNICKQSPPLTTHCMPFDVQLFCCRWSGMRPTNWLFWACKFLVAINEQSDMSTACKFQYLNFFASSHYSFHFFDVQVFFVVPQVCDTLIYCVWHVNFGWLSTDNPTWLQDVSSNICNSLASSHWAFHVFDVQVFFVVPQLCEVCDPLIDCVWHVNFGWLSTNNLTWLQGVSSNICKKLPPHTTHCMPFDVLLFCFRSQLSVMSA